MKKITLLFMALILSFTSYAQFPESFDGGPNLPAGWVEFEGANGLGTTWSWSVNDDADYAVIRWSEILPAGQTAEDWLVTPLVAITANTNQLTFDMTDFNDPDFGSEVTVRVSTGSSQTDISGFTDILLTIDELDTNGGGFEAWSVDLSAYVGSSIYVAFVMENNDGDAWGLDNVDFSALPACLDPVVNFEDFTATTADITTNFVGNFDIEWGVFPYTQGSGGNTATITNSDNYQITSLTPGVSYNVFVRQNCGTTNGTSDYVEVLVGTSPDLSSLPYSEDFEPEPNQALLVNFGLSFVNTTGSWNYSQDDLTDGDTTNDFAFDGVAYIFSNSTFTDAAADAKFYVGPFNLTTSNEYVFSFNQRTLSAAEPTRPAKDIDIIVAPTNDGTSDTVLDMFDDIDNTNYVTRTSTAFTPPADGEYYFGVHDRTGLLTGVTLANSVFIDALSITSQSLGTNEFDQNSFSHYYNKNNKVLNLESSNTIMTNIEIYSLLGQNVISKTLSHTSETIDVSNLNDGVYLAKVNINGNTETIKFVKN